MATSLILGAAALGGSGLLTSRRARERERAAEAAYPPIGQLVPVGGGMVHAHVMGSGRDIVLLHGASGNIRDFTFGLAQTLAHQFRVILLDRPGLGWSSDMGPDDQAPAAQALHLMQAAEVLGVRRPLVLGHSYGGAIALAWALEARGALAPAAVVVLAGASMPWEGGLDRWYTLTGHPVISQLAVPAIAAFATPAQIEASITGIFAPDPVPPGYAAHFGAGLTLRRWSLMANARQVRGLKPHLRQMAGMYPGLRMPVEIVHGTSDGVVPADIHAIPLARLLPSARLTLLPDTGHMPHHTAPKPVMDAIRRAVAASDGAG
ncbi:alpha/beta fold hydrolase [Neotabrizicola shimadae]|uniref:Alpha/beta hydrolase n=1 Tax=Neotabrizicola shimadae TaxID=2807096 RepID=A0A8G0ZUR6_9RHOB|nr:alpha/beta hydrolase [Neotabrizicola shimadae]QYZ70849.1 alpha/beta hydrolase [Neotabrizicola shimadae]